MFFYERTLRKSHDELLINVPALAVVQILETLGGRFGGVAILENL